MEQMKEKEDKENIDDSNQELDSYEIEEISEEIEEDLRTASKIILIVDDILYVVKSIARILKEEGFFVMTANTGMEAIRKFEKYSPDLITIDQMLPDMLGTKLVEEIRKRENNKKTRLIFISSVYDKEKIKSILQMGVDHYLLKPVSRNMLVSTVRKLLGEKNGK